MMSWEERSGSKSGGGGKSDGTKERTGKKSFSEWSGPTRRGGWDDPGRDLSRQYLAAATGDTEVTELGDHAVHPSLNHSFNSPLIRAEEEKGLCENSLHNGGRFLHGRSKSIRLNERDARSLSFVHSSFMKVET